MKFATNLNLEPEPEICPPRSGGWRVSRRRGRVFTFLAAYVLGLVRGLVCNIGDLGVDGNRLRSSRMLEFYFALDLLVLLVPCTNQISDLGLCNQGPAYGQKPSLTAAVSAPTQPAISFSVLS